MEFTRALSGGDEGEEEEEGLLVAIVATGELLFFIWMVYGWFLLQLSAWFRKFACLVV